MIEGHAAILFLAHNFVFADHTAFGHSIMVEIDIQDFLARWQAAAICLTHPVVHGFLSATHLTTKLIQRIAQWLGCPVPRIPEQMGLEWEWLYDYNCWDQALLDLPLTNHEKKIQVLKGYQLLERTKPWNKKVASCSTYRAYLRQRTVMIHRIVSIYSYSYYDFCMTMRHSVSLTTSSAAQGSGGSFKNRKL